MLNPNLMPEIGGSALGGKRPRLSGGVQMPYDQSEWQGRRLSVSGSRSAVTPWLTAPGLSTAGRFLLDRNYPRRGPQRMAWEGANPLDILCRCLTIVGSEDGPTQRTPRPLSGLGVPAYGCPFNAARPSGGALREVGPAVSMGQQLDATSRSLSRLGSCFRRYHPTKLLLWRSGCKEVLHGGLV